MRAIRSVGLWLVPSAAAACAGAIAAGAYEAPTTGSGLGAGATLGFVALIVAPSLAIASAVTRLLWWAWRPKDIGLVEADGAAPRLAGWLATCALCITGLGSAMFYATWLLAMLTEFKPATLVVAEPTIAVIAALAAVGISRPLARAMTAIARAADARWRRNRAQRHSLLTVRKLIGAASIGAASLSVVAWHFVFRPRIGILDPSLFIAPAIAAVALVVAHAAWQRCAPRQRRIAATTLSLLVAASVTGALVVWRQFPSLTLGIWGDCPLAGFAVERIFGLDGVRARVPLTEFRPAERPGAIHRDIVLITIDTVRADRTPPYRGGADMPVLKALAAQGAVFDWAFSPSNVTRRSIPSMIIGLGPDRIRGRVVGWALRLDPRYVVVAERMRAGGYDTAGFMCCKGFWGSAMRTGLERGLAHLEIEPNGQALARRARAWLQERDKLPNRAPLFMWVHLLEPHNWSMALGESRSDLDRNRLYNRALAASDTALAEFISAFSQRDASRAPIVIVTSDHGESLGDHGQPFHSTDLYNSQIRVPLVISGPGIKPGRISETVSLTGLTPTILELSGFAAPTGPAMDGVSFADLVTGTRAPDADAGNAFAAMIRDRSNPGGVTAFIRGPWKLIQGPKGFELYDRRNDAAEHNNVRTTHPREFDELRRALEQHRRAAAQSPF